ncbi:hypothetical protein ACS0TY_008505 [Phlomoides rotata]
MGRKGPRKKPSFFKIIIRKDFSRLLRLPPAFMQKYGSNLQKNVKLRIESGRSWYVKVESMEDGLFCFSRGWEKFAQDVGLKMGEFLVFNLNAGGLSVDVSVYETSGCKKDARNILRCKDKSSSPLYYETSGCKKEFPDARNICWKDESSSSSPLYYETVLKIHHRSRITPSRTFARAAGLMEKESVEVVGEHHKQCVTLNHNQTDALRVDMAQGWCEFRSANGLEYGKTYSFEFIPKNNIIKVKEVEN